MIKFKFRLFLQISMNNLLSLHRKMTLRGMETVTELYECCPGFTRKEGDFGCEKGMKLAIKANLALRKKYNVMVL